MPIIDAQVVLEHARQLERELSAVKMHLEAACKAAGLPETSSEPPLSSVITNLKEDLADLNAEVLHLYRDLKKTREAQERMWGYPDPTKNGAV